MSWRKIFNFRFWLYIFVAAICGILFAVFSSRSVVAAFSIAIIFLIADTLIYAFSIFNKRIKINKLLLCVSVFVLISALFSCITLLQSNEKQKIYKFDGSVKIVGTVDKVYDNCFYLSKFTVTTGDSFHISRKFANDYVIVRLENSRTFVRANDKICCYGELCSTYELQFKDDKLGFVSTEYDKLEKLEQRNIGVKLKSKIQALINKSTNGDESGIMYAMIFGDKSGISKDLKENYSTSGMSHLLAVSGLHVGFLLSIISYVVDKIFRRYSELSLLTKIIIAFLYLYLCNFAISAVRAVIMAVCLLYAKAVGRQGDSLSSLSFAGVVLLLINPMNLFDIGFELSFLVVLSIISLSPVLNKKLKNYLPKWLSFSLSVSLSAYIGSLPLLLYYFSNVGIWSVLANLIIIPYVSIAFMLLILSIVISLILPKLSIILKFSGFMFGILNKVVESVAGVEHLLTLKINLCGILLFICGIMTLGQYYIGGRRLKRIIMHICVLGIICGMLL